MCRLGNIEVPASGVAPDDHIEVWLIDDYKPEKNPNLDFVLTDAVAAIVALRAEPFEVRIHRGVAPPPFTCRSDTTAT